MKICKSTVNKIIWKTPPYFPSGRPKNGEGFNAYNVKPLLTAISKKPKTWALFRSYESGRTAFIMQARYTRKYHSYQFTVRKNELYVRYVGKK